MLVTKHQFLAACVFHWLMTLLGSTPSLAQQPAQSETQSARVPLAQLAKRMERVSENHWRLTGQGEIELGSGVTLFADLIDLFLDKDASRIVASGNVVFANPEGRISAERVEFDIDAGTGTFHQASGIVSLGPTADRTLFGNQDPDVYFWGETIEKLADRRYRITRGAFTTCVQPTPRWEVASGTVTLNLDDYAFARNTVLKVKGVPVLYLPVMYYPIQNDDRATGFLLPTYGQSTTRGQAISNAFFWAIGRSHDATIFHDWFTRSGQGGGSEYRYVAGGQSYGNFRLYGFSRKETVFGSGSSAQILPASDSFQVTANANQLLGARLRARAYVDYFSDIVTQQLYQQNIYQATSARRSIEGSLNGVFGITSASVQFQRNEYLTGLNSSSVYGNTPRVAASIAPQMLFGMPLYASVNSDYAFVADKQLFDGRTIQDRTLHKWDLAPTLRLPLSRLTYLSVNTSASYRTTYYSKSSINTSGTLAPIPLTRQFLSLRSDFIGPVLTKIWDTPNSRSTERMKHVIEPTFAVDYTTQFANQTNVPVTNDLSSYVVGGATRLTYGLNNRVFYRGRATGETRGGLTREFVTIGIQQTYYSDSESSLYDTGYQTGRSKRATLSPVALTARVSPTVGLDANSRLEYDVNGNGLQLFSAGGSINSTAASANLSYSRQRSGSTDATSYLSGSSSVRFMQGRVTGTYALNWDIARAYVVSQTMIGSYMAQCCGFQIEAQNFNYPSGSGIPISNDRRINFSFVLAGLGSFSNFFGAFGGGQTVR